MFYIQVLSSYAFSELFKDLVQVLIRKYTSDEKIIKKRKRLINNRYVSLYTGLILYLISF